MNIFIFYIIIKLSININLSAVFEHHCYQSSEWKQIIEKKYAAFFFCVFLPFPFCFSDPDFSSESDTGSGFLS